MIVSSAESAVELRRYPNTLNAALNAVGYEKFVILESRLTSPPISQNDTTQARVYDKSLIAVTMITIEPGHF